MYIIYTYIYIYVYVYEQQSMGGERRSPPLPPPHPALPSTPRPIRSPTHTTIPPIPLPMRTGRFEWRKEISRKQKKMISFLPTAKKRDRKSYTALGNGYMIQNFLFGSHEYQSGRYRPDFSAYLV